jgi:hypothetical protein
LAHIATLPDGSVAALTLAQGVTHMAKFEEPLSFHRIELLC